MICQFAISLTSKVNRKLRSPHAFVNLNGSPFQLNRTNITCSQAIHHKLNLCDFLRLVSYISMHNLHLQLLDFIRKILVLNCLLDGDAAGLVNDQHSLHEIFQ
jgi:hypothetical protein